LDFDLDEVAKVSGIHFLDTGLCDLGKTGPSLSTNVRVNMMNKERRRRRHTA